ncbi:MAG: hypothetical protein IJ568_07710 [Bacilli bacterium]|nr:hypothetical protein [Bacilli bacterium]
MLESAHSKKINNAIDAFRDTRIKFYTLYKSNVKYNKINKNKYKDIFDGEYRFKVFNERIK